LGLGSPFPRGTGNGLLNVIRIWHWAIIPAAFLRAAAAHSGLMDCVASFPALQCCQQSFVLFTAASAQLQVAFNQGQRLLSILAVELQLYKTVKAFKAGITANLILLGLKDALQ